MITEKIGRKCKQWMIEELVDLFKESENIFVVNLTQLNVSEQEELRNELRRKGSFLMMVKNSICKRAFCELNQEDLIQFLKGPSGVILGKNNPISIAKILVGFSNQYPDFMIQGGLINDEIYLYDKLEELAKLPSKQVLLAKVVNIIGSPMINFLQILDVQVKRLVYVLFQIKDKRQSK